MHTRNEKQPYDAAELLKQIRELINELIGSIITKPSWSIQILAYISAVIYIVVTTYNELVENDASADYALARGAGAAMKTILVPTIFFPVSRMALTQIANIPLVDKFFISSEDRLESHKLMAAGITVAAVTHTVAHIKYNPRVLLSQPGLTGMTMLGSIALPLGGMYVFSKYIHVGNMSYGLKILGTHRIGASIFLAAYACHTSDYRLMIPAIISVSGHMLDYAIQNIFYTHRSRITSAHMSSDSDMLSLKINVSDAFMFKPGQYARLNIPSIDVPLEYPHPFTIVNKDGNELEFIIRKAGPWTNRLFDWVKHASEHSITTPVTIAGPFGNSLTSCNPKKPLTFISTGIGMTPLIAYIHYLNQVTFHPPELHLHVSHKNASGFTPLLESLETMASKNHTIKSVHFYLTGNNEQVKLQSILKRHPSLGFFTSQNNAQLPEPQGSASRSNALSNIHLYFHRPDLRGIVSGKNHTVAVCGNPELTKAVKKIADECEVRCYKEAF